MRRMTQASGGRVALGRVVHVSLARSGPGETAVSDVVGRVRGYLERHRPERRRGLDRRTGFGQRIRDEVPEVERRSGEDRRSGTDRRVAPTD